MWAYAISGPRQLQRVEAPTPSRDDLETGQVLLRPIAGGICGSDVPFFKGLKPAVRPESSPYAAAPVGFPLHEIVAEVIASRSDDLDVGARVVGWAEGSRALAEYVVADDDGLVPCDTALEPHRAVMIQPLACVLGAVDRLGVIEDQHVAVLGLGPIGVLFSHVLWDRGARYITGIDVIERVDVASTFKIDEPVRASAARWASSLSEADRPAIVVEAIGHQTETLSAAVEGVAMNGLVYYFGIPSSLPYILDMTLFLRKQLRMGAGTTLCRRHYLNEAINYLERFPHLLQEYVTNTYPVERAQSAYEAASVPTIGQLKVTLDIGT
jgi:L-iditol 2-dehydrogenase